MNLGTNILLANFIRLPKKSCQIGRSIVYQNTCDFITSHGGACFPKRNL